MKKKDFEQLRQLKQELDTLRTEYAIMPRAEEVGDTYGDYRSGRKVIKTVRGPSTIRSDKLRNRIEKKQAKLEEQIEAMENYLDEIEDPVIRDILRLYYANGLTQEEIGKKKNYSRQRIGQLIDEFWAALED